MLSATVCAPCALEYHRERSGISADCFRKPLPVKEFFAARGYP
jgi:hypothetical protein